MDRPLEQLNQHAADAHPPEADAASLPVSETFTSIQGEGTLAGVPSYFLRVAGCNLRCVWCDTPYASWNPEGVRRSVSDLIAEGAAAGVRHAVLTGGEPMIFDAIATLAAGLRGAGMHITIETAGTVFRTVPCDLMSISPKLANSTPRDDPRDPSGAWAQRHEARRTNLDALAALITAPWAYQLKFVVASPADIPEIEQLLTAIEHRAGASIPPDRILLMPEGVAIPPPGTTRWIADLCVQRGWRYCPRLHIELYGNTRGT
ncbi:MAG: 7-carboxy-7-deazaguanine synthase QueE [Phycisphaerales bacterium]